METTAEKKDGTDSVTTESSTSSSDYSFPTQFGWPIGKAGNYLKFNISEGKIKPHLKVESEDENKKVSKSSEIEMMKERFAKLLLGEDMSGSGKGVCPALTISNAITNLCATVFGQLWRLEPLPSEKKQMWRREMNWLLSVSDHIVELKPSWQTFPNGRKVEVMSCQPRSDLFVNLPALQKLDNMLLEILEGFSSTEFWYVDQGVVAPEAEGSVSFKKAIQRQEEKWWLPVPRVPHGGLPEGTRKQLSYKLESANQILKAATSINNIALAEMEVPQSYLDTLPKTGRACLGDVIYRYITSEHFSSECLLDCLDLSSEHAALEMANRVEAAIYVWLKRQQPPHPTHCSAKSSWGMVKDLVTYKDKRELLAERGESFLQSLKQRFPGLTQTTLDASKIQYNKDVGKSILESYSRVLESLAFNIAARIEDLLYVDDINKQSDKLSSSRLMSHKKIPIPYSVPLSGTPYRTAYETPNFSPASVASPARGERTAFRGLGVKRVLTNYLSGDSKAKNCDAVSNRASEGRTSHLSMDNAKDSSSIHKESISKLIDR